MPFLTDWSVFSSVRTTRVCSVLLKLEKRMKRGRVSKRVLLCWLLARQIQNGKILLSILPHPYWWHHHPHHHHHLLNWGFTRTAMTLSKITWWWRGPCDSQLFVNLTHLHTNPSRTFPESQPSHGRNAVLPAHTHTHTPTGATPELWPQTAPSCTLIGADLGSGRSCDWTHIPAVQSAGQTAPTRTHEQKHNRAENSAWHETQITPCDVINQPDLTVCFTRPWRPWTDTLTTVTHIYTATELKSENRQTEMWSVRSGC